MSKKQSKHELIKILQKLKKPVKFREIDDELNHAFPERTLRRWLSELYEQKIINKTGVKKGTHYQIVNSKDRVINSSFHQYLSTTAKIAIDYVQQLIFNRKPVTYNDNWIKSYIPNQSYYLSEKLRTELAQSGTNNLSNACAVTYAREIFNYTASDEKFVRFL